MPVPAGPNPTKSADELTAKFVREERKLHGRRVRPDATLLFAIPELDYQPSIPIVDETAQWPGDSAKNIAQTQKRTN